jgi:beta-galactosidase
VPLKFKCCLRSLLEIKHIRKSARVHTASNRLFLTLVFLSIFHISSVFSQFLPVFPSHKFFVNGKPTRLGADAALYPDSPTRIKIDLAGSWNYSFDDESWNTIEVPSAYTYHGSITFQRKFEVTTEMIEKYTFSLVAYGINYQSEITINGNFIGRHIGSYTSFIYRIPANVLEIGNENVIKIVVDNDLNPTSTLPLESLVGGLRSYGGIFRDIYLLATPKLSIEDLSVTTALQTDRKSANIVVQAEISDHESGEKAEAGSLLGIQCQIFDKLQGELAGRSAIIPITPRAKKSISQKIDIQLPNPKLWSPAAPDLYVVKCQIVKAVNKDVVILDEYSVDIGVRTLAWKNGNLSVNDSVIVLKGILWNEDHETFGSALTYEIMERDIASIVTLGANLIRFRHPPHPYVLNLCDRYGLLVMEDVPLINVPYEFLSKESYQDLVMNFAREMVTRDRNHVSVLAWGIGDEFETGPLDACEFINSMRNAIKAIDQRYVYYASSGLNDRCYEYVDIIGLNSHGEEAKQFRDVLKSYKERFAEKPVVVVRYGTSVEPGNKNGYSDPYSMEYQSRYAVLFYNMMTEMKIAGGVFWSYNDWFSDRPALTARSSDPYLCTMGIVNSSRDKRTGFNYIRTLFKEEKVQALPVGNYSPHTPLIYVVAGFIVLIALAFLYNANRRFRDGVNRSLFRTYNFFADVRDQRILPVSHSFFLALVISVTWAIVLSSIFTHYRSNLLLDNILSQFLPDAIKERFVQFVWDPPKFILIFSIICFVKLLLIVAIVRIISMMVKTRVYTYNAFTITIWSMLPSIILIPVSMILLRLMETEMYVMPVFILIGIIILWIIFRLLKGISIIYDVVSYKVYAIGILLMVIIYAAFYSYIDYTHSASIHVKYLIKTLTQSK